MWRCLVGPGSAPAFDDDEGQSCESGLRVALVASGWRMGASSVWPRMGFPSRLPGSRERAGDPARVRCRLGSAEVTQRHPFSEFTRSGVPLCSRLLTDRLLAGAPGLGRCPVAFELSRSPRARQGRCGLGCAPGVCWAGWYR